MDVAVDDREFWHPFFLASLTEAGKGLAKFPETPLIIAVYIVDGVARPRNLLGQPWRPPFHQSQALPTFVACQGSAARERLWAVPRRSGAWNGAKKES